jgi:hypothetical protein
MIATSHVRRSLLALAVALPLAAGAQPKPAAKAAPSSGAAISVPLPPPPGTKPAARTADGKPAPKQKLAVFEIRALGTEAARAELVSEIALTEASAVKGYDVVGKSDIVSMLGFERQKVMLGCTDDSACLAELGGALGVDLVLVGSLGRIGALYRLDLKLVDSKKAKIKGRVGVNVEGQEEKIVLATQRAVRALLDPDAKLSLTGPNTIDLSAPAAPPKPRGLGWTAIGTGVLAVGLGAFAVYEGTTAKSKYSTASGMLEGGVLKVDASAASYGKAVSDGNSAKTMAYITGGAAVGCAVVSGVLAYVSYRRYGEIGPIRF